MPARLLQLVAAAVVLQHALGIAVVGPLLSRQELLQLLVVTAEDPVVALVIANNLVDQLLHALIQHRIGRFGEIAKAHQLVQSGAHRVLRVGKGCRLQHGGLGHRGHQPAQRRFDGRRNDLFLLNMLKQVGDQLSILALPR